MKFYNKKHLNFSILKVVFICFKGKQYQNLRFGHILYTVKVRIKYMKMFKNQVRNNNNFEVEQLVFTRKYRHHKFYEKVC